MADAISTIYHSGVCVSVNLAMLCIFCSAPSQVSEEAVMKRKSQGWVVEATHDLDEAIDRAQAAAEAGHLTGLFLGQSLLI